MYHTDKMTVEDMLETIVEVYELDDFIANRLEFHYDTYGGDDFKSKTLKRLKGNDLLIGHKATNDKGEEVMIGLEDLQLGIRHQKGDTFMEDISCDSTFMLQIMPKVGKEIRKAFHWVSIGTRRDDGEWEGGHPIYLVLDSAGGHGTIAAVQSYKQMMKNQYNIILVHQITNSPETNVLDLGIWMSLQNAVEKTH